VNLLHTQLATTQSHVYVVNGRGTVQGFALNTNPIPKIPRDARYVVALAAGDDHCLALSFDGTVSAWGENDYNQCNVPSNLTNVIAIAANQACSMALTATGNVIVWGDDDYAQTAVPTQLEGNAQAIAAGVGHCAAITTSGKVVAWGNLEHMHSTITRDFTGRAVAIAADNDTTLILDDQQILWLFDDTVNPPKKVTTARDHNTIKGMMIFEQQVYLYLTDNRILTVETKTFNKLQYMNTSTLPYQGMIGFVRYNACNYIQTASHVIVVADTPTRGTNPEPRGFAYQGGVASTLSSMKALSHEHYVQRQHAYRHISHIACGNGYVAVLHAYKIHVFGTLDVKTTIKIQQLYGQANHLYAIDTQQRALVFGDQQQAVLVPTGLQGRIQAISIQAISFGAGHGVALLTGDMLNVWGDNSQGQLNMPRISQAAVAVATGLHHSLALLDNGRVIGWGGNKFGQATVPEGLDDIIQICASGNTSAALHKDGSVHVWGELRSRTASTFEGLHDVIAMALGPYHGAFLFRDGSVRTWGQIDPKHRPTFTPSDPVVAIACGNGYTAALTMNRRIVAWGTVSLDQQLPV
jgi:alpha-tubulin suppressor-like RCC1 family protein